MKDELQLLRGLHPGIILDRKLKEMNLSKGRFALSIDEYPQTLGAITRGKRSMNVPLAMKIEHALGLTEGYLMILQIFYDISEEKRKQNSTHRHDLSKLRPALFWDTDIKKVDWIRQRKSIIKRVR